MELMEQIVKYKSDDEEVHVSLHTVIDEHSSKNQIILLTQIKENLEPAGLIFSWEFDESESIHARHLK
jgi:ATP-dependent Lon protease